MLTWRATGCRRCCENFLYVFKAARNGPLAPPPGRAPGRLAVARGRARLTPVGWREDANTRARQDSDGSRVLRMIGRQPAGRRAELGAACSRGCGRDATRCRPRRGGRRGVCGAAPPSPRALRVASDGRGAAALDLGASATPGAGYRRQARACPGCARRPPRPGLRRPGTPSLSTSA